MNIEENYEQAQTRKLIPVTQWGNYHPWPSVAGLRHLVFHEHSNGFATCVRRIGRRVLIDEAEFFKWVDSRVDNNTRVANDSLRFG